MTRSTEEDVNKLLYRQSHREALDQLSALFKEEIMDKQVGQVQNRKSHRRESSISSMRLQPPRPTQSQSQLQALESFLRRLGISTTIQGDISLAEVVSEKRSGMTEILYNNLKGSAEMPLLASLGSSDEAKELLTSTLQASDSSYSAEPSLVDPVQKGHLTELDKELAVLQKGIEGVDLDILAEPNRLREKFIEKWGQP